MVGTLWQRVLEAADHIASTVRRHRVMNAAAQFVLSFFLFSLGPAAQGTAAALPTFFGWGRTLPMSITLF